MKNILFCLGLLVSLMGAKLFTNPLEAAFSSPQNVSIPSLAGPITSSSIAIDPAGNSIAVWTEGSSIRFATLENGSITWSIPLGLTPAIAPSFAKVVVDNAGNAYAAWEDSGNVFAASLPFGTTAWQNLLTQVGREVDIDVNETTGDAVLVYIVDSGSNDFIQAQLLPAGGNWQPSVSLSSVNDPKSRCSVFVDNTGNVVFGFDTDFGIFHALTQNQATIAGTNLNLALGGDLTLGNISGQPINIEVSYESITNTTTFVWTDANGVQVRQTNRSSFFGDTTLSTTTPTSPVSIGTDGNANIVAVWQEPVGGIATARSATYNASSATWSVSIDISTQGTVTSAPQVGVAPNGNAFAAWNAVIGANIVTVVADLPASSTTWGTEQILSSTPTSLANIATNGDQTTAVWTLVSTPDLLQAAVDGSFPPPPPPPGFEPLPPTSFIGEVIKNKFASQTEYVHRLTWTAAQDPTVVGYHLYRDGILIGTFTTRQLTFDNHNRRKNREELYQIASFNTSGVESTRLSVTLR